MTWTEALSPHVKAMHVGFVSLWIAGLFALQRMLARHDGRRVRAHLAQIRHATYYSYVWMITPTAVLAVATGTALIFLRGAFTVWLFAKLVLVVALVAVHARIGHAMSALAEDEGERAAHQGYALTLVTSGLVVSILTLVLAKPAFEHLPLPPWMRAPLGRHLPFDVPIR